jgi:hypothetical protein
MASVLLVGVDSASHCGGGHDRCRLSYGLLSLCRRRISQALWFWTRHLVALLWPLYARSAWAQAATALVGTTAEGTDLDSVHLVMVGSATHCGGGHDCLGYCSDLFSLGRRGHRQKLRCRARQMRALLWPLFARSAWTQKLTVVANTSDGFAALSSVS